jgi:hypothetical protein
LGIGKITDGEEIENPAEDNRVTNFTYQKKEVSMVRMFLQRGVFFVFTRARRLPKNLPASERMI